MDEKRKQMISIKCSNCGAEMSVDTKGNLYCPYCQSTAHFSDDELKEYREYRMNMLQYLRASADENATKADSRFLNYCDSIYFNSVDDQTFAIDYQFFYEEDNVKTYITQSSVVFVFEKKDIDKVSKFKEGIELLQYPSADMKGLSSCFPSIKMEAELEDGRYLLAVSKEENAYPLFAFGSIAPVHVAWIVSRLENMACVFEYSQLVHGGMSMNTVFINTRTHQAFLLGGWWKARKKFNIMDKKDLYDIRKVANQVMGELKGEAPKEFIDFVKGAPATEAYSDFSLWDTVIEKGFGGHKFVKF